MESIDSSGGPSSLQPNLPPGFRFHPTDEELVVHYLKRKATSAPLPVSVIAEVDLYKFDPWELPAKAAFGEQEWYFFSPRERKYPNGERPNRAATSGYWKATGTEKPVLASNGTHKVGFKKALVFYGGKPPKGVKTSWIMHEYRLAADTKSYTKPTACDFGNKKKSLRLDDWVLCRIYKKNNTSRHMDSYKDDPMNDISGNVWPAVSIRSQENIGNMNTIKSRCYGVFSESNQNVFEGFTAGAGINDVVNNINSIGLHLESSSCKPEQPMVSSLKGDLPPPFWAEEGEVTVVGESMSKQFHGECLNTSSLLTQRTPPLINQEAFLGDGIFGLPYNLSGFNWYALD